jgi:hypothetical protein
MNFRGLSNKDNELYQRVDEVLHYLWDPIGISDVPEARDEYHSYLPHVFSLLKAGVNENDIADYLGGITADRMGMGTNRKRDLEVAEILICWRELA